MESTRIDLQDETIQLIFYIDTILPLCFTPEFEETVARCIERKNNVKEKMKLLQIFAKRSKLEWFRYDKRCDPRIHFEQYALAFYTNKAKKIMSFLECFGVEYPEPFELIQGYLKDRELHDWR